MEVSQTWWRKWRKYILTKMFGQMSEHYYPVEPSIDQLLSTTKFFTLEDGTQSEFLNLKKNTSRFIVLEILRNGHGMGIVLTRKNSTKL